MSISDEEVKRLDTFWESHLYVDSPDNPLPDMKVVRDVLEKSTHIHNLADSMLLTALLNGPRDTIIMALINGSTGASSSRGPKNSARCLSGMPGRKITYEFRKHHNAATSVPV